MRCIVYHCKECSLELRYYLHKVVGLGSKCAKSGLYTEQSTEVLDYHLGCRIDLVEWLYFFQSGL